MKSALIALSLLISAPSLAEDVIYPHDHLDLTRPDHQIHILAAYALAFTGTQVLEQKVGLSRGEATAIACGSTFFLGVAKEVMIDDYNSKPDTQAFFLGAALSALTTITFKF
jgi:hypothetical protein